MGDREIRQALAEAEELVEIARQVGNRAAEELGEARAADLRARLGARSRQEVDR